MAEKVEKRKIDVNGFFSALAFSALRCRITVFCGNIIVTYEVDDRHFQRMTKNKTTKNG